jgi:hypothetical protein
MSETVKPDRNAAFGTLIAPSLVEGSRTQMLEALYSGVYAQSLPRPEFDKQIGAKSDLEVADAAYAAFYKDKMPRPDFNKQVGLTTARGSTNAAFMSGATMGWSDEIGGALDAVIGGISGRGFGDSYNRSVKTARENASVYRQNNPYFGKAMEIAGGLVSGGALAKSAASAAPVTLGTMARQGAALGGITGAGEAEGGFTDRLQGAGFGAGLGAAAPYAVAGISRAATPIARSAANLIGLGNPEVAAQRQIGRAIGDAGMTTGDVGQAVAGAPGGKPIVLADVTGQPGRQLAATVANRPGGAMQAADAMVEARRAATPDRIAGDVDRMVGRGSGGAVASQIDDLLAQRSREAAPLYEEAFSKPAGMTTRLREFIDDPIAHAGLARGLEVQRLENLARPAGQRVPVADHAIQFAEDGTPRIVSVPNMRTLDSIKRGLDDILEQYRQPSGRLVLDQRGRAVERVRRAYVEELSQGNPAYNAARAAWAGPSEAMDAIAMGRKIVTADRDVVARQLADMSPTEREFFRIGIARALTDRTTDPSHAGGFVRRLVEDRNLAGKVRSAFDNPKEYQQFVNSMRAELTMRDTNRVVSPRAGSQTARLLQSSDDMANGPAGGIVSELLQVGAHGGRPTIAAAQRLYQRGQVGTPAMAEAIGSQMLTPDRAMIAKALQSVEARQVMDSMDAQTRAQIARALLSAGTVAAPQATN